MINPTITIECITPDIAEKYLDINYEKNRPLRQTVINTYARDMKEGRWLLTPQSMISFDENGRLINGQHRLYACVQSGCSFVSYVARNVPRVTYVVTDIGLVRTVSDQIDINQARDVAALANRAFTTRHGVQGIDGSYSGVLSQKSRPKRSNDSATKPELVEDIKKNGDEYLACINLGAKIKNIIKYGGGSQYAYFCWLCKWLGEDGRLEEFINSFIDMNCTVPSILHLRTKLLQQARIKERRSKTWLVWALLHAYDAYRLNKDTKTFKNIQSTKIWWETAVKEKREANNA